MIRRLSFALTKLQSKFSIHPLFWVILGLGILSGRFRDVIIVFTIVFIHEMGHVAAAVYFNWRIKEVKLLPFGGVAEMEEHGNRPIKEELIVVMMGPLQHIWMIGVAFALVQFGLLDEATYRQFAGHNASILFFNLIPVWPLDGGRLLLLLSTWLFPFRKAYRLAIQISFGIWMMLTTIIFLKLPFHMNLWVVLLFLLFSHYREWKQLHYHHIRFLIERCSSSFESFPARKTEALYVHRSDRLYNVMNHFYRNRSHKIFLKQSFSLKGIDEQDVLRAYFMEKRTDCTIGELFG